VKTEGAVGVGYRSPKEGERARQRIHAESLPERRPRFNACEFGHPAPSYGGIPEANASSDDVDGPVFTDELAVGRIFAQYGITVTPIRARKGKPSIEPRSCLRITAPVPDPTTSASWHSRTRTYLRHRARPNPTAISLQIPPIFFGRFYDNALSSAAFESANAAA
jgi:hypothetical protein